MQRLYFVLCFPYFNAMENMSTVSEGYAYHMFSLFLRHLNSKQTLF